MDTRSLLDERRRVAREIHDTLLQSITGIALQLRAALPHVQRSPATGLPMLERIAALAEQTSREARRAVWNLRAAPLEGRDFTASIEHAARQTIGAAPIWLGVRTVGRPRALGARTQLVVLRVVGEAVANAVRHSSARRIRVTLHYRPNRFRVCVADDGRGFAIEPNCRSDTRSCGLLGMRERACEISASLEIRSALGKGTRIILAQPLASRRERRLTATATCGTSLSRPSG